MRQNVFKKECLRVIRRHLLFFRSHHRLLETGLGSINKRVSYRNDMEQKVTNTNGKRIEIPARTPEIWKSSSHKKTPQRRQHLGSFFVFILCCRYVCQIGSFLHFKYVWLATVFAIAVMKQNKNGICKAKRNDLLCFEQLI